MQYRYVRLAEEGYGVVVCNAEKVAAYCSGSEKKVICDASTARTNPVLSVSAQCLRDVLQYSESVLQSA